MGDISTAHLSEPGLAVVEIVAQDEATVREVVERLTGSWASSGVPAVREGGKVPGQRTFTGRVYVDIRMPAPGRTRKLPADWVRFHSPPWGGQLGTEKPTCLRNRADGRSCRRQAAEWPRGYGAEDPYSGWR
ncbi:DUF6207 family protein [Streptomyces sp. QHH-9511]|uniref:DUF6207 family protein n=1 Tax=Streptomyces sp. QHH-9511 TaxID=2684468 RepID=UPI0018E07A33|nr:DUF6207 family protein [Streptomyces sp. QHH-9511]